MINNKLFRSPAFWAVFVLFSHLMIMSGYLATELRGNIEWHVLPSEMFGLSDTLKDNGMEPIYTLPGHTGWDGQFYFSIANDPFALSDTPDHIDASAYRYQRIGLPLLAKGLSIVLFQDWVSPAIYYLTSLLLVFFAVYFFAVELAKKGVSPVYSVFWGLGVGTTVTLLNGLPDAAADALLVLAVIFVSRGNFLLFSLFATFAALSREAYVLLSLGVLGFSVLCVVLGNDRRRESILAFLSLVPLIVFFAWQEFVKNRFGVSPADQAAGILGFPFVSFFENLSIAFDNLLLRDTAAIFHFCALIIFEVILLYIVYLYSIWLNAAGFFDIFLGRMSPSRFLISLSSRDKAVLSLLPLPFLYMAFGNTVMFHYTGYLKAANLFFFLGVYVYFVCLNKPEKGSKALAVCAVFCVTFTFVAVKQRVFTDGPSTAHHFSVRVNMDGVKKDQDCFENYSSKIELLDESSEFYISHLARKFWSYPNIKVFRVLVTNTGRSDIGVTKGSGAVRMSYQWLDPDSGAVLYDGLRSDLQERISPEQSHEMDMVVRYPENPGDYQLVLSLVQEGCAWYYSSGDRGSLKLAMNIE